VKAFHRTPVRKDRVRDYPRILVPPPGPKAQAIVRRDEKWTAPCYIKEYPLVISHGRGPMVEDVDGNRYLDFMAGIAVSSTGYSHPRVGAAIKEAADFMDLGAERPYLDALSDISFSIEEQVGTGNDFFTIWTVTGRHTGELCGIAPSGQQVTVRGITMSVIKERVIATEYTYWDFPGVTEQLMSAAPT